MLLTDVTHIAYVTLSVIMIVNFHVVPLTMTMQVINQRTGGGEAPWKPMLDKPNFVKRSTLFMTMIVGAKRGSEHLE